MTEHNKCFSPSPQSLPPLPLSYLSLVVFFHFDFFVDLCGKCSKKMARVLHAKLKLISPWRVLKSPHSCSYLQLFALFCSTRERAAYLPRPARGQPNYGEGGQIDFLLELGKWAAIKHVIPSSLRRLWPFLYTFHNLSAQNGVLQVCANIYCRQQETWQIWQSI